MTELQLVWQSGGGRCSCRILEWIEKDGDWFAVIQVVGHTSRGYVDEIRVVPVEQLHTK